MLESGIRATPADMNILVLLFAGKNVEIFKISNEYALSFPYNVCLAAYT